jgi:hypothetical protein
MLSFTIEGEIKNFHDKHKPRQFMTLNQECRRCLKEFDTQKRKKDILNHKSLGKNISH